MREKIQMPPIQRLISPVSVLILVLVSQLFPGVDLTHHLETSRLYHEMIIQGTVLFKNPYLMAGQQPTFTYGIPFYIIAGVLWSLFGRFTIDVLMFLTTFFSFLVMRKMVKDENSQTMCCSFLHIENALSEFEDPKVGLVEGIKRAFSNCIGILALYRLGTFLQLLGEMNDIGMVKIPVSLSSGGIDIVAIGAMLRDGFVTLTRAGSDLLDGFYADDEED